MFNVCRVAIFSAALMAVCGFTPAQPCCELSALLGNGARATAAQPQGCRCQHSSPARRRRNFYRRRKLRVVRLVKSAITKDEAEQRKWCRAAGVRKAPKTVSFPSGLGQALASILCQTDLAFSGFVRSSLACAQVQGPDGRKRDIFPLPLPEHWPEAVPCQEMFSSIRLVILQCCLSALNFLAIDFKASRVQPAKQVATASQLAVTGHVACRCAVFLERLAAECPPHFDWSTAFARYELSEKPAALKLSAEAVDMPAQAGTCDPSSLLSEDLLMAVSDAHSLFSGELSHTLQTPGPTGKDRVEYIKLVLRQLDCKKVRLRLRVRAVAEVFPVSKTTPGRQREVWNGSLISDTAAQPPKPRFLASPACFVDIQAKRGEALYFSKRDVGTCFDVIQAPDAMQEWFGQPAVTLRELSKLSSKSLAELRAFVVDRDAEHVGLDTKLFPASTVWRMGFSWSSAVAQDCTVSCCLQSGVPASAFLCMEQPPPVDQTELCAVATDDTVFVHRSQAGARKRLEKLDAVMVQAGMPKNASKDVNWDSKMVALGCELYANPPAVEPSSDKLFRLFSALVGLLLNPTASPKALSRALGVAQWFCLLQRPMFSVFDKVYDFVRDDGQDTPMSLPPAIRNELAVATFLMPLLGADLSRDYLGKITACDACPEFGFGVSSLQCSREVSRDICQLAERHGDYVRLYCCPGDPLEKDRLGKPHRLPFSQQDFHTILSKRARWKAHSGILEAHGLLLAVKWLARSPKNHSHRVPLLVDAKAVLGAASKGRSSAPGLRGILRQIAALSMGCDFLIRLVYIPSESNPSDSPSRGIRSRPRVRKTVGKSDRGTCKFTRQMLKLQQAALAIDPRFL